MKDPIVEEVRRHREAVFAASGNNLGRYLDHLRELEKQHPQRVISKAQLDARRGRKAAAEPIRP